MKIGKNMYMAGVVMLVFSSTFSSTAFASGKWYTCGIGYIKMTFGVARQASSEPYIDIAVDNTGFKRPPYQTGYERDGIPVIRIYRASSSNESLSTFADIRQQAHFAMAGRLPVQISVQNSNCLANHGGAAIKVCLNEEDCN